MALTEQKSRLLDEFRLTLREEAVKAIQSVMFAAKENFTRLALKELNEAHEAGARANYARWIIKIEQDMESARQQMTNQAQESSQHLETMAVGTIERVQRSMETTRSEAVDRFVSRLREQIAPMFAEARDTLQTLAASETAFINESHVICARLESESKPAPAQVWPRFTRNWTETPLRLPLTPPKPCLNSRKISKKLRETICSPSSLPWGAM